jgi:hypothetical protein
MFFIFFPHWFLRLIKDWALLQNLWVNLAAAPARNLAMAPWHEHRPRERQSPHCPDFFTMAGDYGSCPRFGLPGLPRKRHFIMNSALK